LPDRKNKAQGYGNREPKPAEIQWCWNAHVHKWLTDFRSGLVSHSETGDVRRVIVPVGVPATRFLLGIPKGKGAVKYFGTANERDLPSLGENDDKESRREVGSTDHSGRD
jgi:hypothetical protein